MEYKWKYDRVFNTWTYEETKFQEPEEEDMLVSNEIEIGDRLKMPQNLITKVNTLSAVKDWEW